ncbi:MAG: aspartate/glutamate racemase family protein [Oligosphaeraceae bacterium]|nr:aspartate/glutamate racemase family protein [Oligosphaeraceae bacterium]
MSKTNTTDQVSTIPLRLGILGGLGPFATLDLFDKILRCTPAKNDQEHLHIVIDNNPRIPDRTAALLHGGPSPLPAMLESALRLQQAGVRFIVIPCNTAHAFVPELQGHLQVPILNMIEAVKTTILRRLPNIKRVGLLATSGTILSRVYAETLAASGIQTLSPASSSQEELVMSAIYGAQGIKALGANAPLARRQLLQAAQELIAAGAEALILGCTEIPLAIGQQDFDLPCFDPAQILAEAAVTKAMRKSISTGHSDP